MKAILEKEGMSFDHVVRQWNYIGNILEIKNGLQNYQVFNEVRSEFYKKYRTVHGYPAATGIGMCGRVGVQQLRVTGEVGREFVFDLVEQAFAAQCMLKVGLN